MDCYLPNPLHNNATLNVTVDQTDPAVYLARAIVLSVAAAVSSIGVILNLTFICRKKTNFLVRRLIYFTVVTTLQLGAHLLSTIVAFTDGLSQFRFNVGLFPFTLWAISVLLFSITFTMLRNVYCHTYCSRQNFSCRRNRSQSQLVCLELLLVALVLVPFIPGIVNIIILGTEFEIPFAPNFIDDATYYVSLSTAVYFLPVFSVLFSAIIALLVKFCHLRKRQIARRTILLKEIGVFFFLLIGTLVVWTFSFLSIYCSTSILITTSLLSVLIALFPLYLFVYMYRSFRTTTRLSQVRFANVAAENVDDNIHRAEQQTNPPSTRVSLPTDTAEHAPNFLSPSTAEPSEMTTLINYS